MARKRKAIDDLEIVSGKEIKNDTVDTIEKIAKTGKLGRHKRKPVYSRKDSVKDIGSKTKSMLSSLSRKLFKSVESQEKEKLDELVRTEYSVDDAPIEVVDTPTAVRAAVNVF